jgi:nucleotide-binding universal stress UspA family protein
MSFAQILVPLTGGPRDEIVLSGAFAFAKPFQGHVVGLFVRPDPVEAMPFYGEGMSSAVVQEIMDVSKKATSEASRKALATMVSVAGRLGAAIADPSPATGSTGSFREAEGAFAEQVARAATLSDVVVFGPLRENDRPGLSEAFESTLLNIGRPVLLVAQEGGVDFSNVAIAWNGSIASAHAVSAALPLLKKTSKVEILVVKRPNTEPIETDDILTYLRLHGVEAAASFVDAADRPVADVLLDAAAGRGARMLVAGGYGHNRLRELFVTGTTRRVVAKTAIPCFLVH